MKISNNSNTESKDWAFEYVIKEFKKESDRAAVILVAASIEEALFTILKSFLIPIPSSTDNLFDGPNAALSTFSSKIDMSYRLGLISSRLCRDLHLIRKIRNAFAHDIYGCNFENGGIKSRVKELSKNCEIMPLYEVLLKEKHTMVQEGTRGVFLFVSSLILFDFNYTDEDFTPLKPIDRTELIYTDGKNIIDNRKNKPQ